MSEQTHEIFVVRFASIARLMTVFGVVGGLVAAAAYIVMNFANIAAIDALLVLGLAPLFQTLVLLAYAVLGYPVYRALARRRVLGLDRLARADES